MQTNNWATNECASDEQLNAVQDGLPIQLIATTRKGFSKCRFDEPVSAVVARDPGYDHWPVEDAAGCIVGLLDLRRLRGEAATVGFVESWMRRLDETNLMGADASILCFVRSAHVHSCRLLLSGSEISGLVTVSDLHKLPVRVALFCLITHLEITMGNAIAQEGLPPEQWRERLSEGRKGRLLERIAEEKKKDIYISDLLLTEFCDKATIIRDSPCFGLSRNSFKKDMDQIQKLRNKVAHASEYAGDSIEVSWLSETVGKIEAWTERFAKWPETRRPDLSG